MPLPIGCQQEGNLRSRWQHKPGAQAPGKRAEKFQAREAGESASAIARFAGSICIFA